MSAETQRRWRERNADHVREYQRARYLRTKEQVKARSAKWARENRERRREICHAWTDRNPDYRRTRYQATRQDAIARAREWNRAHPEVKAELERRRRALKLAGSVAPFSRQQLEARMSYWGNACWMCGGPFEHVDHVKPLTKGGAHILANLRPACGRCNRAKGNAWPLQDAA